MSDQVVETKKQDSSPIIVASDHGGFELKEILKDHLVANGYEVLDVGTYNAESVDYPDFADAAAALIKNGDAERAVLVCGSGIGISIRANRYPFVRAALVHDALGTRLCRQHNDANVLVLGGRTTGVDVAKDCLDIFLKTDFEGGRHARRVLKLGTPC